MNLERISKEDLDKEVLRAAIIAELDAVNLYEQMAALTDNSNIKTVLMEIAKEEKTYVGEFQTLLLMYDKQQKEEWAEGKKEVEESTRQINAKG
jgi:rubrerythrin